MPLAIHRSFLNPGEWYAEDVAKDLIFLHHTAGSHRPDWTVAAWNRDMSKAGVWRPVATAFVIGGISTSNGNADWDGVVVQCFPEAHWAYHLGVRSPSNLDRRAIAIELCNYGPLTRSADGRFFNYVRKPVPESQVEELATPFRGYMYYHRYTEAQLESLRGLLVRISSDHSIDLRLGLREWLDRERLRLPEELGVRETQQWLNDHGYVGKNGQRLAVDGVLGPETEWARRSVGKSAFEFKADAYAGHPGLWTHANVRTDKSDCSPQLGLMELIRSL